MRRQSGFLSFLARGYDHKSAVALLLVLGLCVGIGIVNLGLLRANWNDVDWVLLGLWAGMAALLCRNIQPARDLALAGVALAGGFAIEWWGTHTQLWRYFTGDAPPVWILPAWPIAALAAVRIATALERGCSRWRLNWTVAYWIVLVLFATGMFRFVWPSRGLWPSQAAAGLIVLVIATGTAHRRDLCLFVAGAGLGFLLEYWGTSRECWTYYSGENPPLITAAAHGFAQVCYARTLDALTWLRLLRGGRRWRRSFGLGNWPGRGLQNAGRASSWGRGRNE